MGVRMNHASDMRLWPPSQTEATSDCALCAVCRRHCRNHLHPQLTDVLVNLDQNIKKLADAGANVFVAGSHVFKSENQPNTITNLKRLANS